MGIGDGKFLMLRELEGASREYWIPWICEQLIGTLGRDTKRITITTSRSERFNSWNLMGFISLYFKSEEALCHSS